MKKKPQVKYFVNEVITKSVSKREFLRIRKEEIVGDCTSRAHLVRNKVFTTVEINKLKSLQILVPIEYGSKIYFKKDAIAKGIEYLSGPTKLFNS